MDGIPQAPSFPMQENLLVGSELICNSDATYTFSDVCKIPSTVTWSISPNLQIVSSTGYSVTVSQISNGQGTITATFQNGQTVTKNIWVGKPSFNLEYNYFEPQPVKSTLNMVSDQPNLNITQQGITSTTFVGTSDGVTYFNMIKSGLYGCRANLSTFSKVIATATNACGTTTVEFDWLSARQAGNGGSNSNVYKVYPNPSNDIVNIDLRNQNNQSENGATISGELFDMMGQSKSRFQIINNRVSFSVQGLNKGIYVLKIYINNQVENHQIAVE